MITSANYKRRTVGGFAKLRQVAAGHEGRTFTTQDDGSHPLLRSDAFAAGQECAARFEIERVQHLWPVEADFPDRAVDGQQNRRAALIRHDRSVSGCMGALRWGTN